MLKVTRLGILIALGAVLTACSAGTIETPPARLASASVLKPDAPGTNSWSYRAPGAGAGQYKRLLVEQTIVYAGPGAEFDGMEPTEQWRLAGVVDQQIRYALAEKDRVSERPGPDVARLRVSVVGVRKGAALALGADPGSIDLALEGSDSVSGQLVAAQFKRYRTGVLDLGAPWSTSETVRVAAQEAAAALVELMERPAPR